jgi:hypothetical protein
MLAAGCTVNVEGAPCATAGTAADCPGGQACGNDLRCSVQALGCAATRCAPGAFECAGAATAVRCDAAADPVCGRWQAADCAARPPDCAIVADPRAGQPGRAQAAGSPQPPECRFARLTDALDAAAGRAVATTVRVEGGPGGAEFGAVTPEEWPLVVTSNVSLLADVAGPEVIVRGEPGETPLLSVQGALEGVRVVAGGATGVGIAVSCDGGTVPLLRDVTVDGEGVRFLDDPTNIITTGLITGITVSGACGATLADVDVELVSSVALSITADPASATTVQVLGGSYRESNFGIHVWSGKVLVAPSPETAQSTIVTGNAIDGIVIGRTSGRAGLPPLQASLQPVGVRVDRVVVSRNGGGGIVAGALHSASRVSVTGCDISGNGAVREPRYGTPSRGAGGMLVSVTSLSQFTFNGNRLWSNAWDQLAFDSLGPWLISADECGPETNVFACMPDTCRNTGGVCAVAVPAGGAVGAMHVVWPGLPTVSYASPDVTGLDADEYCTFAHTAVPPAPTCL